MVINVFLIIVDNGGGWTRVFPLKSSSGRQIAYAIGRAFVGINVEMLRTDNASNLKSQYVEKVLKELDIEHIFSIPYKSNTNGVAERAIKECKDLILTTLGKR